MSRILHDARELLASSDAKAAHVTDQLESEKPQLEADRLLREELDRLRWMPGSAAPHEPCLFSLADRNLIHAGNLAVLAGPSKSGKSAILAALLASTFAQNNDRLLGWRSFNQEGKALIYFDCEQSRGDFHRLMETTVARAGEAPPDWFSPYNVTSFPPSRIWHSIDLERERCQGIFAIVIDGFADLILSPNDEMESFEAIRRLHQIALEENCAVIGVLHTNSGSESVKARGHIGSQAERKAEVVLNVHFDKNNGASILYTERCRHAPLLKSDGIRFAWDSTAGMHLELPSEREIKHQKHKRTMEALTARIWRENPDGTLPWREVIRKIEAIEHCKERTAGNRLTAILELQLVEKALIDGHYVLTERGKHAVAVHKRDNDAT